MAKPVNLIEIQTLKLRCAIINRKLNGCGVELQVYESGSKWCVVALVNTSTLKIIHLHGLNALSKRDRDLTKAFLSLVQNGYMPSAVKQAA